MKDKMGFWEGKIEIEEKVDDTIDILFFTFILSLDFFFIFINFIKGCLTFEKAKIPLRNDDITLLFGDLVWCLDK